MSSDVQEVKLANSMHRRDWRDRGLKEEAVQDVAVIATPLTSASPPGTGPQRSRT